MALRTAAISDLTIANVFLVSMIWLYLCWQIEIKAQHIPNVLAVDIIESVPSSVKHNNDNFSSSLSCVYLDHDQGVVLDSDHPLSGRGRHLLRPQHCPGPHHLHCGHQNYHHQNS